MSPEKLNDFFVNDAFFEQQKRKCEDDGKTDGFGSINIPDNVHFFFALTKDTLFVLSSRRNDIAKTQAVNLSMTLLIICDKFV